MVSPIDFKIVEEFERAGPRYTSYPTAPTWKPDFKSEDFASALNASIAQNSPLSLYLHLPFCEKLCHFCACNKVIDPKREHAAKYLEALVTEIELIDSHLQKKGILGQMHWGGGTPTFYSPEDLEKLFSKLEERFTWGPAPEISLEVNPVVTTINHLATLAKLGFNRISLGVQDFDEKVQDVINRHQTFEQTKALVEEARGLKFANVNLDLIYGLPLQTQETISKTIEQVLQIRPERIALYSYANVPWKQPFQRRFHEEDLPKGSEKISLYITARNFLIDAGYAAIGMDHFALPEDELFKARLTKTLHRNFMGYTTQGNAQMIAAGISGISMLNDVYTQNKKTLPSYYADLKAGKFPIERGSRLTFDDLVRRKVILDLMCNFEVSSASFKEDFQIEFESYFRTEIEHLKEFETKNLVKFCPDGLKVTARGELLVRNIAMVFDTYLSELPEKSLFSQTV